MRSLTDRETRIALDVVAGAAIVSVVIALAGLVWRIAGHADSGAVTVPGDARVRSTAIDLNPALALAPFGKGAVGDDAAPTGIQAVLKGIVFARPQSLATAFVAIGAEAPRPFRIGETVAGATIAEIRRDRIILTNGGRAEYLAFPDPFADASGAAASGGSALTFGTPPVAAPAAAPAPGPAGAQALIQRLNATPVDGGYAIGAGAPAGLRSGDVVQSVNGAMLSDPASVNAALAGAAQSGVAQVTILRDGRPVTVTVPIR